MAANPSEAHQADRHRGGRAVACAVSHVAAQAPPHAHLKQEEIALNDMETESRNQQLAGMEERDEFALLFDLLDDEGRERVLAFARRFVREDGSPATAGTWVEGAPVGRMRRLGRPARK